MIPAADAVDHFLLGAADLDRAIALVEAKTGVRAAIGGSHPGVGTRNALMSLGGKRYLEIIAPDPAQSTYTFRTDLRALAEPRLIGWAAVSNDIEALANMARAAGRPVFGPRDGSRLRPDGKALRWKTLGVGQMATDAVEPLPFFIEWAADSVHPSQDSPKGCELEAFAIEHPTPGVVADALKVLGIDAKTEQAARVALVATLKTPRGRLVLR